MRHLPAQLLVIICVAVLACSGALPAAARSSPPITFSPPCPGVAPTLSLGTSMPVLLVHGFAEGPDVWTTGERSGRRGTKRLPSMWDAIHTALGAQVKLVTFDYSGANTNWVTDPLIGPRLAGCITWLAATSAKGGGPGKVIVVAHSMGGLAVRCAVDSACVNADKGSYPGILWPSAVKSDQLGLVITLGTPNLGSNSQMLGSIGEALCPKLSFCVHSLLDLRNTPAAKAMLPDSAQLRALPLLPTTVPVDAIAGKITYISDLFGQSSGDLPPDPGDLVVPVNSALADQASGALHAGPGSGGTSINCGKIPLGNINTWLVASDLAGAPVFPVTCWHLTETTDPTWQTDVVESIRAAIALPEFYVHNGYELGSLFKYPNFPTTIGLDNHDYLSGLHWALINSISATATGTLNTDNCMPNCASGSNAQYSIKLLASDPQHCTVAVYKQYSSVAREKKAYVYNKIQLKALSGSPPPSLVGFTSALPPACSPLSPSAPTPTVPATSPSQPVAPKKTTLTVTVPASGGWVNTGLSLNLTDSVSIKASGSWTPDGTDYTGPGGFGNSLLSADNYINLTDLGACADCAPTKYPEWAALMSYTGSNPPQPGSYTSPAIAPQANKVDYVGSSLTTTKFWPYKGELWLAINDDAYSANTSDNYGQVTATITVISP